MKINDEKENKGWFSAQKLMDEVNQLSIEELNEFEETNQEGESLRIKGPQRLRKK